MLVIDPDRWRAQPWKNGRGVTCEVLRLPDLEDYDLRISVAGVTSSGPFSTFPGYTRWTLLLDGGPVVLAGTPLAGLFVIDGAVQIDARVDAPARLLNVIGRGIRVQIGDGAGIVFDCSTLQTRLRDEHARDVWIKR